MWWHGYKPKEGGYDGDKRGDVDVRSEPNLSHGLATRTALLYSRLPRVRRYLRGCMPCSGHAPSGTHAVPPRSASEEAPKAPKQWLPTIACETVGMVVSFHSLTERTLLMMTWIA